ncbi:hypothetical protein [Albibacterium bauzanense]|uniref:Uncharacterized protein n=1 Tax=Albibacterium bauzanense TaxID=653929 RepID=A0A4R1LW34_9SPHI|nr:hypothetical protein [Albibacterium bauzanense]TCK83656.1 hypothetical protein C8N28_2263 [Albibacterium bauzanense]
MKDDSNFRISVTLNRIDQTTHLKVHHKDETFEIELDGKIVAILNNGDNSWSSVDGDLDQLTVNLIGDAIEQFYKEQGW